MFSSSKNIKKQNVSFSSVLNAKNEIVKNGNIIKFSDKNTVKPEEITKESNDKFKFIFGRTKNEFECSIQEIIENDIFENVGCYGTSKLLCCDLNCDDCFKKSFVSKVISFDMFVKNNGKITENTIWSKNNKLNPRLIFKSGRTRCKLICPKFVPGHEYETDLSSSTTCKFPCCSGNPILLCGSDGCVYCHHRSFASHEKSKYFSMEDGDNEDENGKKILPGKLFKRSKEKFIFVCPKSKHKFEMTLENVVGQNSWCPYPCCKKGSGGKLCGNDGCEKCFKASFASIKLRLDSFSSKNNANPHQLFKFSKVKYLFNCSVGHEFEMRLLHVSTGSWCSKCRFIDETECIKIIEEITGKEFKKQRPEFMEKLELDGYNEDLKLALEYNGQQHYNLSSLFHKKDDKMLEAQKERDSRKIKLCKENGIFLIIVPYWERMNKKNFIKEEYEKYLKEQGNKECREIYKKYLEEQEKKEQENNKEDKEEKMICKSIKDKKIKKDPKKDLEKTNGEQKEDKIVSKNINIKKKKQN
jgi:hypothetical protein